MIDGSVVASRKLEEALYSVQGKRTNISEHALDELQEKIECQFYIKYSGNIPSSVLSTVQPVVVAGLKRKEDHPLQTAK